MSLLMMHSVAYRIAQRLDTMERELTQICSVFLEVLKLLSLATLAKSKQLRFTVLVYKTFDTCRAQPNAVYWLFSVGY